MTTHSRRDDPLFTWHGGDELIPGEIRDNPRTRRCRHCRARPGEPCTVPARGGGRRPLPGYHPARQVAP